MAHNFKKVMKYSPAWFRKSLNLKTAQNRRFWREHVHFFGFSWPSNGKYWYFRVSLLVHFSLPFIEFLNGVYCMKLVTNVSQICGRWDQTFWEDNIEVDTCKISLNFGAEMTKLFTKHHCHWNLSILGHKMTKLSATYVLDL